MKILIFLIIIFLNITSLHGDRTIGNGTIIVLHGTGSSGKTSISKILHQRLSNSICISVDDFLWPALIQNGINRNLIQKSMPKQEQQRTVLDNLEQLSADLVWFEIFKNLYQQTKLLTEKYSYVILDTVFGTLNQTDFNCFCNETENCSVFSVLVYCSPLHIAEHVIKRNSTKKLSENRDIFSHVRHFAKIYKPTPTTDEAIDTISKQELEKALHIVFNYLIQSGEKKSKAKEKIKKLQDRYFDKFFKKNNQKVQLQANFPFDIMVNTAKLSSEQCTQLILDKLPTHH